MRSVSDWQVESSIKAALPTISGILCVMLAAVHYGIPYLAVVMPWLALIPVYYWSIHEPRFMPYWAAFLIGLWQDLVTGGPLGLCALVFVVVRHFVVSQRLVFYKKPFLMGWWGLALVASLATAGGWFVASLYASTLLDPVPYVVQTLLTVLLYPLVAWALGGLWQVVSD